MAWDNCFVCLPPLHFPLIFIATWNSNYKNAHNFFALMLLVAGRVDGCVSCHGCFVVLFLLGTGIDTCLFSLFSMGWRKKNSGYFQIFHLYIRWFIVDAGRYYLLYITNTRSVICISILFIKSSYNTKTQNWLFWLIFVAFAIKMPMFPFHTWQPDTYEQSPTAVTMVLSGVMVKMGVFGLIRWLLPVFHLHLMPWGDSDHYPWPLSG